MTIFWKLDAFVIHQTRGVTTFLNKLLGASNFKIARWTFIVAVPFQSALYYQRNPHDVWMGIMVMIGVIWSRFHFRMLAHLETLAADLDADDVIPIEFIQLLESEHFIRCLWIISFIADMPIALLMHKYLIDIPLDGIMLYSVLSPWHFAPKRKSWARQGIEKLKTVKLPQLLPAPVPVPG